MENNNLKTNYLSWFSKAGEDELSAKVIIEGGGSFSTACFLFQQMAEKYLKGLIVFKNLSFLKVHDLLELETILLKDFPDASNLHEDLKILNRYYIETRYPGDYPEFTLRETKEAFESTQKVKSWVLGKVNL